MAEPGRPASPSDLWSAIKDQRRSNRSTLSGTRPTYGGSRRVDRRTRATAWPRQPSRRLTSYRRRHRLPTITIPAYGMALVRLVSL